ncbi:MAG: Na+/H+ antiporter NhaC family protein [Candidatus Neomarinimicrobiota bacterium]|nr:MAG: Na+/H+ antiporter NhaC family protein [Candidatus Neomarinimicrobiota bacterium]
MKMYRLILGLLLVVIFLTESIFADSNRLSFEPEGFVLSNVPFSADVNLPKSYIGKTLIIRGLKDDVKEVGIKSNSFTITDMTISRSGSREIELQVEDLKKQVKIRVVPGWLSLLPPLVAIVLALITREMLLSLFVGIWSGVTVITCYNPISGFFKSLDTYVVGSLANHGHASIIIFSLLFGGMIGIFCKNGGMLGIVNAASKYAKTRRSGQLATSIMGVVIFFDDYANTLLVGNTMRPFTDKLRISREKLAYIVDSTAAPVANLALISTWSVFQMSLLDVPYSNAGITVSPYITFIKSIPYGFYSIFALWLLFWLGIMRRDFGPMYKSEIRAIKENKVLRDGASPLMDDSLLRKDEFGEKASHWLNAVIPIVVVISTTIIGLYVTGVRNLNGLERSFHNIIGKSNSYASLMWGAALGGFIALILSVVQKLLSLKDSVNAWLSGIRAMVLAAVVLVLAWTLGHVCEDLKTAEFIINNTQNLITSAVLPIITFIVAVAISFSTGTSWGTMTILVPLIIPMALKMTNGNIDSQVFLASFAAILSGATFGDHCSPISDTTILSSMASGSDHIDHVKTQFPYAVTAGVFAALFGYIPAGFGIQGFYWMVPALILVIVFVRFVGKSVDECEKPILTDNELIGRK